MHEVAQSGLGRRVLVGQGLQRFDFFFHGHDASGLAHEVLGKSGFVRNPGSESIAKRSRPKKAFFALSVSFFVAKSRLYEFVIKLSGFLQFVQAQVLVGHLAEGAYELSGFFRGQAHGVFQVGPGLADQLAGAPNQCVAPDIRVGNASPGQDDGS